MREAAAPVTSSTVNTAVIQPTLNWSNTFSPACTNPATMFISPLGTITASAKVSGANSTKHRTTAIRFDRGMVLPGFSISPE